MFLLKNLFVDLKGFLKECSKINEKAITDQAFFSKENSGDSLFLSNEKIKIKKEDEEIIKEKLKDKKWFSAMRGLGFYSRDQISQLLGYQECASLSSVDNSKANLGILIINPEGNHTIVSDFTIDQEDQEKLFHENDYDSEVFKKIIVQIQQEEQRLRPYVFGMTFNLSQDKEGKLIFESSSPAALKFLNQLQQVSNAIPLDEYSMSLKNFIADQKMIQPQDSSMDKLINVSFFRNSSYSEMNPIIIKITNQKETISLEDREAFVYESNIRLDGKSFPLNSLNYDKLLQIQPNKKYEIQFEFNDATRIKLPNKMNEHLLSFLIGGRRKGVACMDFINDLYFGCKSQALNVINLIPFSLSLVGNVAIGQTVSLNDRHFAIYLANNLYISVMGNDHPLYITTLEQMKLIYNTQKAMIVIPKQQLEIKPNFFIQHSNNKGPIIETKYCANSFVNNNHRS